MNKLLVCKETREIAAKSLAIVLKRLLDLNEPISESMLRDNWLDEVRKNNSVFPDGWYEPPPHGMGVLFGSEKDINRISPSSLRLEEFWPRNDIILDRENGIIFVYMSLIDKNTGIIGDFGLTLYLGKNEIVQNHLKKCLQINKEIFEQLKVGMEFKEINMLAFELLKNKGLSSNLSSPSDPTGTNIGHTIPASYEDWENWNCTDEWQKIKDMISKKRKFVNSLESLKIRNGMAFTIEPRPFVVDNPTIPKVWFHTIAVFKENGEKELLTNFDELFKLTGMDYIMV